MLMISKLPLVMLLFVSTLLGTSSPALAQLPGEQPAPAEAPQPEPAPPYAGQPSVAPQYPQQYSAPAPVYVPPASYPYPTQPPPARPSKGMMVTGIAILGGSYLFSAVVGAALFDQDNCGDCSDVAPFMFIPVLGPFLAIKPAEGDAGLLALLGVVETVGAGLTIGGIIRYKNTKRRAEQHGYYTFQLPKERSLSLDVSASPLKLGPQLRLRF